MLPRTQTPHAVRRAEMTFVARVVRQQGQALQFASEQLRRDPGLVRLAAEADFLALKFADPVLLADKHFMRRGMKQKRGGSGLG